MSNGADATREITRLLEIMARLRAPGDGCPWDLEQDFASIAPYTIEEAYEVAAAIADDDMPGLKGELGDLLFQVVFHARMAEEAGHFDFAAVARAIADKMVARHPHVFGDLDIADATAQSRAWEAHKAEERAGAAAAAGRRVSVLEGLPLALPALMRALKLQGRAARVGFDWPAAAPVIDKVAEELDEMRQALAAGDQAATEEEFGDLLFSLVNLARHLGVDPEDALRRANTKFERRFRRVEALAEDRGEALAGASLAVLDRLWNAAKAEE
jgi:nucleoside triphosphate diphosphatase